MFERVVCEIQTSERFFDVTLLMETNLVIYGSSRYLQLTGDSSEHFLAVYLRPQFIHRLTIQRDVLTFSPLFPVIYLSVRIALQSIVLIDLGGRLIHRHYCLHVLLILRLSADKRLPVGRVLSVALFILWALKILLPNGAENKKNRVRRKCPKTFKTVKFKFRINYIIFGLATRSDSGRPCFSVLLVTARVISAQVSIVLTCVDTDSCCVWRLWSPCHMYVLGIE